MKRKATVTALLLASLAATPLVAQEAGPTAPGDINTLSPHYSKEARFTFSESDVLAFLYRWFAGFDHQLEPGYFLKYINEPVDMRYPDFPIHSKADFRRWYKGVTDTIQWNSHHLSAVSVSGNQKQGWHLSYDVRWRAKTYSGTSYDMTVHQELDIIRVGDTMKITKLRAAVQNDTQQKTQQRRTK